MVGGGGGGGGGGSGRRSTSRLVVVVVVVEEEVVGDSRRGRPKSGKELRLENYVQFHPDLCLIKGYC